MFVYLSHQSNTSNVLDYDNLTLPETDENDSSSRFSELAKYEAYLRREFPPHFRHELYARVDSLLGQDDEILRNQLPRICLDLQVQQFRSFLELREARAGTSPLSQLAGNEPLPTTVTAEQLTIRMPENQNDSPGLKFLLPFAEYIPDFDVALYHMPSSEVTLELSV